MINRKRNALTILRPPSRRSGLFLYQKQDYFPAFVSFPPRLFTFRPIRETNTGKSFARYALSSKADWRACEERNTQTSRNTKEGARSDLPCSAIVSNTKRAYIARVHNHRFSRVFKNRKRSIIINALRNAFNVFAAI